MLSKIANDIENALIALAKLFKQFKVAQFLGLYLTWKKTERWLSQDDLPAIKRDMILVMQDATLIGLRHLNWWVPRQELANTPVPDPQKIQQAAFLEKLKQKEK